MSKITFVGCDICGNTIDEEPNNLVQIYLWIKTSPNCIQIDICPCCTADIFPDFNPNQILEMMKNKVKFYHMKHDGKLLKEEQ